MSRRTNSTLTADQQRRLVRRWRELGDEAARETLLRVNHGYIVQLARRYVHLGVPEEDLVAMAQWGLAVAIDRFDYTERGAASLLTYASWWMRKHILAEVRRTGTEARFAATLPYRVRDALAKVRRATVALERLGSATPTVADLVRLTGLPAEDVADAHRVLNGGPVASADSLADRRSTEEDVPVRALRNVRDANVRRAFGSLGSDYQRVLRARLGLDGDVVSERALADDLGVSRRRVRQLSDEAHEALREAFEREAVG